MISQIAGSESLGMGYGVNYFTIIIYYLNYCFIIIRCRYLFFCIPIEAMAFMMLH